MTLIQLFQFILSISILVILHELGHFIPAKLFKTKVEKFYLFFDPWFSLVKKKIGGTEYGIGWLPFGGYVKIAGMVDESMDTEQLKKPAQPWEFRSKPAWQRLIIMMGGVTVNFFLAWLIYASLSYFKGETYHDNTLFENGISVSEAGRKMGLQSGDKILKIDGKPAERMETSTINMLFADNVTVLRGEKEVTFPVNEDGVADVLAENQAKMYYGPRFPVIIDSLLPSGGAKAAGLMKGDRITAINGQPVTFFDELGSKLSELKNQEAVIDVERNSTPQKITVKVDKDGKLGFAPDLKVAQSALEKTEVVKKYSVAEAIPRGLTRTIDVLTMQIKQFKIVFNTKTEGYKKVSVKNCAVGKIEVNQNHCAHIAYKVENATLTDNIVLDSNKSFSEHKDGTHISQVQFNKSYLENRLDWDFDSVWQWDDKENIPILRPIPDNFGQEKTEIELADNQESLLAHQLKHNIWL